MTTAIKLSGLNNTKTIIKENWISGAETALLFDGAALLADGSTDNCIEDSIIGISHIGTSFPQPFTNNWWGDASGPSGLGMGSGAEIQAPIGGVLYEPWLTSFFNKCNKILIFKNDFEW